MASARSMLFRFSAYGFLKNQRYFEPFLILAFLDRGLSFAAIGTLVAVREFTTYLLEIPSGAVADTWGRRRSLVLAFSAYCLSFLVLGFGNHFAVLAAGMALYGFGDAFRSGTHKALILSWLEAGGRLSDKTTVYGYTRSWSKLGSAASVFVSAGLFVFWGGYRILFLAPLLPYGLDLLNVATYPVSLEGASAGAFHLRKIAAHLKDTLVASWKDRKLRRILAESLGFQGYVKAVKDYLQPAAKALSHSFKLPSSISGATGLAAVVAPVYLIQYLLEAAASRRAGSLARRMGGEDRAARILWGLLALLALVVALAGVLSWPVGLVVGIIGLVTIQNLWRPVLVGRVSSKAPKEQTATVLSLDSQGRSLATMLLAPLLGLSVDLAGRHLGGHPFWPLGVIGLLVALLFSRRPRRRRSEPGSG